MSQLGILAGSVGAVLLLALAARLLGLGGGEGLAGAAEAIAEAEAMVPGFEGVSALLGSDGRAALVRGAAGDAVLLKRHGARLAARHIALPADHRLTADGLEIDSGDPRFGPVRLTGIREIAG